MRRWKGRGAGAGACVGGRGAYTRCQWDSESPATWPVSHRQAGAEGAVAVISGLFCNSGLFRCCGPLRSVAVLPPEPLVLSEANAGGNCLNEAFGGGGGGWECGWERLGGSRAGRRAGNPARPGPARPGRSRGARERSRSSLPMGLMGMARDRPGAPAQTRTGPAPAHSSRRCTARCPGCRDRLASRRFRVSTPADRPPGPPVT